jgi:hypothetical protein
MSTTTEDHPILAGHPAHKAWEKARAQARAIYDAGVARAAQDAEVYREALRMAVTEGGPTPAAPPDEMAHRQAYQQALNAAQDAYEAAWRADADAIEVQILEREAAILAEAEGIARKIDGWTSELAALVTVRNKLHRLTTSAGTGAPAPVRTPLPIDADVLLLAARRGEFLFREPLVGEGANATRGGIVSRA